MTPLFVAEMGGNHGGSLKTALKTIDAAKKSGADYVKFQSWQSDTMAVPGYEIASGPWAGRELLDLYRETHTPWHWHHQLFQHAREIGIIPFSTPFDAASVALLEGLDCPMYKIASLEINDTALLRAVAATKKPIILSTGAASDIEISYALNTLGNECNVTLLHCVSSYPTPYAAANLPRMLWLKHRFPQIARVGISDHSTGSLVAIAATTLGAEIIEKHFILDRSEGGPDCEFSMEPREFRSMVRDCRDVASMLVTPQEDVQASSRTLKRTLYYARNIPVGGVVSMSDLKTARPALGLNCSWIGSVVGKVLVASVKEHQPVQLTDVESVV